MVFLKIMKLNVRICVLTDYSCGEMDNSSRDHALSGVFLNIFGTDPMDSKFRNIPSSPKKCRK